jgi:hypothetical protein
VLAGVWVESRGIFPAIVLAVVLAVTGGLFLAVAVRRRYSIEHLHPSESAGFA